MLTLDLYFMFAFQIGVSDGVMGPLVCDVAIQNPLMQRRGLLTSRALLIPKSRNERAVLPAISWAVTKGSVPKDQGTLSLVLSLTS